MKQWLFGIGAGLILTIIMRIVNNGKLIIFFGTMGNKTAQIVLKIGNTFSKIGATISRVGVLKFGNKLWETFENFIENSLVVSARAFYDEYKKVIPQTTIGFFWTCFSIKGLDEDNGK